MSFDLTFSHVQQAPQETAIFRQQVKDFIVVEDLGFMPSGEGEHVYVEIRKRSANTSWISDKLAEFFGVKRMDVSYSGMKDRHAETTQWFSAYLPGKKNNFDWPAFVSQAEADVEVLQSARHNQKLRRGTHRSNHFKIRLRSLSSNDDLQTRLRFLQEHGAPNYFGEQRFGHDGGNLVWASDWLENGTVIRNKQKRGMVMSAARSYLFNLVLAERVRQGNWNSLLEGDPSDSGQSTGPLWGRGRNESSSQTADIEAAALAVQAQWLEGLEHCGLNQERRPLVLKPNDLHWQFDSEGLEISFSLLPGQYATALLRELCLLDNQSLTS